jgi:hypothetical protein
MENIKKLDFIKDETAIENELIKLLPKAIDNNKLFVPNWENKPVKREPILFVNGVGILTYQNVSCIIAAPGVGKSSICESICAAVIGTNGIDTLGLTVSNEIKNVLYIDNERTDDDVWNSFERAHRRALTHGKTIKGKCIDIVGLRMVAALKERKETIEALIKEGNYQLVIIDGAGDLVNDTNSLAEAIECRIWFRELTSKYKISILTTLHPNKGTVTPRGHIGSEIAREAETVLGVIKEGETRTITSDFAHGKSRNSGDAAASYIWSDSVNMFVSCDTPGKGRIIKLEPIEQLSNEEIIKLVQTVVNTQSICASDLIDLIKVYLKQNFDCKNGTNVVKEFIAYLFVNEYLTKTKKGVIVEYQQKTTLVQSQMII